MVALVTADAVRLPNALVIPARSDESPFAAAPPGASVRLEVPSVFRAGAWGADLGAGRALELHSGGVTVRVVRWWAPPRPRITARALGRLDELRELIDRMVPPLPPYLTVPAEALRTALASHQRRRTTDAVTGLLGLGPGLTPVGDDVLAATLVTLFALGRPDPGLAATVSTLAPARTTAVSTTLLTHAATGHCIPQLACVLAALDRDRALSGPVAELVQVGHTSGAALAHGALLALGGAACPS
jgi:hypothetical protein